MNSFVNGVPKISVLMPVYNCELYIKEAIDSILNQTFDDFEFIIIDDCSTDNTIEIIKTYNDSRIQLIEKSINSGISNSLNLGINLSKGYYIARMDGDDISFLDRFAKQVAFMDSNPNVILCGSSVSIIGSNLTINYPEQHDMIKVDFLRHNCIMHPSVMLRKDLIVKFQIFYDVLKEPAEDYDLWIRLLSKGRLHNIQEDLLYYRFHSNQITNVNSKKQKDLTIDLRLSLLNNLNCKIELHELEILKKIIQNNNSINFDNLQQFLMLKRKLILGNLDSFFEPKKFENYLDDLEKILFNKFFLKRNNYSPIIYFNYLRFKSKFNVKLSNELKLKLFLKSMLFWKLRIN
jgi:glycosyltransferase involved in cell wall biosynthesis